MDGAVGGRALRVACCNLKDKNRTNSLNYVLIISLSFIIVFYNTKCTHFNFKQSIYHYGT